MNPSRPNVALRIADPKRYDQELAKILAHHARVPLPCQLCGTLTNGRGVLNNPDPAKFGTYGKRRAIIYPICENHTQPLSQEDAATIEALMLKAITAAKQDTNTN